MIKENPTIWYSFKGGRAQDDHIGYYNNKEFEWVKLLEDNYDIIKQEIHEYIVKNDDRIKPYFNKGMVTKEKSWRAFSFLFWNWKIKKNMKECPKTMEVLSNIPFLISASVSILEPGVEIKPHKGDTNAIIRCHFGLEVPVGLPHCGFSVNDEKRPWEEGKVLLFNDSAKHTAWNLSDKRRYILLFDIIRPSYSHKSYSVCSLVLSSLLLQAFVQQLPFVNKLPYPIYILTLYANAFFVYILLRLRSFF